MLKLQRITCPMVAAALLLAPFAAHAGVSRHHTAGHKGHHAAPHRHHAASRHRNFAALRKTELALAAPVAPQLLENDATSASRPVFNALAPEAIEMPSLPSAAVAELPTPSVETPLHRLFCVEYARARSGLAVFGDAKFWWDRAKNIYARATHPISEAVMVFAGSRRLRSGHVAVVTNIVSPREIRVDQANWENHGEIDHATPVMDVSANNDWSQVRVWDRRSQTFGAHVYAISGFIAKGLMQKAEND